MIQKPIYILFILLVTSSCKNEKLQTTEKSTEKEFVSSITTVKTYNFNQLKPLLERKDNKTYVVNFWATWCAPCVKELPYFEKIKKEYGNKNVEVLLVSLDFPKQVQRALIPFLNKRDIKSDVILLDDVNEDFWIKAIDENWSGALPATIIYNKEGRKFYEQSFDYETLENELNTFLQI